MFSSSEIDPKDTGGKKNLSEGISHLVVIVSETKGSRGVFIIIRIIEEALLILALVFHYLVGMSINVLSAIISNVMPFPGCRKELLF